MSYEVAAVVAATLPATRSPPLLAACCSRLISMQTAGVLIGQLRVQITDLNEPVQITNIKLNIT